MDWTTALVFVVVWLSAVVPTLVHVLGWIDHRVKQRGKGAGGELDSAEWEEVRRELAALRARVEQLDSRGERIDSLEEQLRFLERLLTSPEAGRQLPPEEP